MWDRSKIFLKKMGGIILAGSILVWALSAFPRNIQYQFDYDSEIDRTKALYETKISSAPDSEKIILEKQRDDTVKKLTRRKKSEKAEKSFMGHIGKALAPIFAPLGIDWRGSVALITGFAAKEIVVSTLGILYATDRQEDSEALKNALLASNMTSLSALAMMVFVLLYLPCLATVSVIKRETGSWKWALFSIAYSTLLAWLVAFCIYQGGTVLGYS